MTAILRSQGINAIDNVLASQVRHSIWRRISSRWLALSFGGTG
ncbi:MAG: hypothetical protein AB1801_19400 [Chloroflexota bacterium]